MSNANLKGSSSGGSTLAFGTIAVAGQSDVVADASPDILTLVAGSNITLTTNAGADSVTISAAAGSGSATWTETELDFGSNPVWGSTFTVTDAAATAAGNIAAVPSGKVATGRVGNDLEWDNLVLGVLPANGSFTVTALAFPGPIVGKRKIVYQIGA